MNIAVDNQEPKKRPSEEERAWMYANAVVFDLRVRNGESIESIKSSMNHDHNPRRVQ